MPCLIEETLIISLTVMKYVYDKIQVDAENKYNEKIAELNHQISQLSEQLAVRNSLILQEGPTQQSTSTASEEDV